jgi:quercetin dioxygenase-like cupin family protein
MKRILFSSLTLALLVTGVVALAGKDAPKATGAGAPMGKSEAAKPHTGELMQLSDLTWMDAEGYPAGVKMSGVCAEGGVSSAYIKFPAGVKILAHTHPGSHWGTIVQGTGVFGFGTDPTKGIEFGPGSFVHVPAKTQHWLTAKTDVIVFASNSGPDGIDYVTATDDPRKGQAGAK